MISQEKSLTGTRLANAKQWTPSMAGNSGYSSLALLVVICIIGILAAANTRAFTNRIQFSKITRQKGEYRDLRSFVLASVDCDKTLSRLSCDGRWIALRNAAGKALISADAPFTKIGMYKTRARCIKKNNARVIDVQVLSATDEAGLKSAVHWDHLFTDNLKGFGNGK